MPIDRRASIWHRQLSRSARRFRFEDFSGHSSARGFTFWDILAFCAIERQGGRSAQGLAQVSTRAASCNRSRRISHFASGPGMFGLSGLTSMVWPLRTTTRSVSSIGIDPSNGSSPITIAPVKQRRFLNPTSRLGRVPYLRMPLLSRLLLSHARLPKVSSARGDLLLYGQPARTVSERLTSPPHRCVASRGACGPRTPSVPR